MFSHDGLKDLLTHLAAPPLFYEELRREVSRMERNGERFTILRLILETDFHSDVDVLNFSEMLGRAARGEELIARLGEYEFAILVRGNSLAVANLLDRITGKAQSQDPCPRFRNTSVSSQAGESALDLLNRLDSVALAPVNSESLLT